MTAAPRRGDQEGDRAGAGAGATDAAGASGIDRIAEELRRRRAEAGNPSYAEIASRVSAGRLAGGAPEFEARVARTTLYDLFRPGRKRIDTTLVLEVVAALGADEEEVEAWRRRCAAALRGEALPSAVPVELATFTGASARTVQRMGWRVALLVMAGSVALNMAGVGITNAMPMDLYLDMVGTAITAIVLGPWRGAVVGALTNLGEVGTSGTWHALWFGLANVAGALVWGFGVRRGLGRTVPRFILLNALVAFCVSAVASVIIIQVYGGHTGHGSDTLVTSLLHKSHSLVVAVVSSNMVNSLCDKMLSGFIALFVADWLLSRQRGEHIELPLGA